MEAKEYNPKTANSPTVGLLLIFSLYGLGAIFFSHTTDETPWITVCLLAVLLSSSIASAIWAALGTGKALQRLLFGFLLFSLPYLGVICALLINNGTESGFYRFLFLAVLPLMLTFFFALQIPFWIVSLSGWRLRRWQDELRGGFKISDLFVVMIIVGGAIAASGIASDYMLEETERFWGASRTTPETLVGRDPIKLDADAKFGQRDRQVRRHQVQKETYLGIVITGSILALLAGVFGFPLLLIVFWSENSYGWIGAGLLACLYFGLTLFVSISFGGEPNKEVPAAFFVLIVGTCLGVYVPLAILKSKGYAWRNVRGQGYVDYPAQKTQVQNPFDV